MSNGAPLPKNSSCSPLSDASSEITTEILEQHKQAANSLIQVIEKLSRIVEHGPQHCCSVTAEKRTFHQTSSLSVEGIEREGEVKVWTRRESFPNKKIKKGQDNVKADTSDVRTAEDALSGDGNNNNMTLTERSLSQTVTCYQCSLCPFIAPTLSQLKEHLKQHNEQSSDLILMCSECHFTSRDQEQLELHVQQHFDKGVNLKRNHLSMDTNAQNKEVSRSWDQVDSPKDIPQKKQKWYSHEEYGLYRCLICSYVCSQQRMLKTHAWKHAGLVDCSYPIFENEDGAQAKQGSPAAKTREEIVVGPPAVQDKSVQKLPETFKIQLCVPESIGSNLEAVANLTESQKTHLTTEEPMLEFQVTTEGETEVKIEGQPDSTSNTDSLLSSAQKIINGSPSSSGRMNVIVERLPTAEDSVMTTNPLLLHSNINEDRSLLGTKQKEEHHCLEAVKEEEEVANCRVGDTEEQPLGVDIKPSGAFGENSSSDENVPPISRKRTLSESLRLHSLAAEALVAMPMRTPEIHMSSSKAVVKTGQKTSDLRTTTGYNNLDFYGENKKEQECLGERDEEGPTTKAGISLSLLTVIERLRERSDQNTTDEDILKELQDNIQFTKEDVAGVVASNGTGTYVCTIPGINHG